MKCFTLAADLLKTAWRSQAAAAAPALTAADVCFPVVECVCAGESLKPLRARLSSINLLLREWKVPLGSLFNLRLAFLEVETQMFFLLKWSNFPRQEGQTVQSAQTEAEQGEC